MRGKVGKAWLWLIGRWVDKKVRDRLAWLWLKDNEVEETPTGRLVWEW